MRIQRCTKCGTRGGHLTFRRTKPTVLRKYPYVGHYDIAKKSKRRWCSLNEKQLYAIEILDDWYQSEYIQLGKKAREYWGKREDSSEFYDLLARAEKLLVKHGFPEDRRGYKVFLDMYPQ